VLKSVCLLFDVLILLGWRNLESRDLYDFFTLRATDQPPRQLIAG
jgi:hypothetical protein